MTKLELITALSPYPDDSIVIRSDADWSGVDIRGIELVTCHRTYAGSGYWTECYDEETCYCRDEDEELEQRRIVKLV